MMEVVPEDLNSFVTYSQSITLWSMEYDYFSG